MRPMLFVSSLTIIACALVLISCSGGSQPGTVNVSLSDPATCAAPSGPYRHVYLTVTDVLIHQSASASANDSGWQDLTPKLKDNPVQVDLLGVANQCFLAMLGSAGIEPGHYQQIRVILGANNVSVANNKCGNMANCVTLTNDPLSTPMALQLSSESQTGIKIPSGQLAGGEFVIGSGETKDLNIDFNACASLVVQNNGQYRLKPVLHAGEVSTQTTATTITGTIIDGSTLQPVAGGNTIVALEQNDGNGVDRVVMEGVAASNGSFSFCPVPAGTYDIVAVAINSAGNTYSVTVITGVKPGDAVGTIPLTPAGLPSSITGQITSAGNSGPIAVDLSVSALQSAGNNLLVTVPLAQQSAATASVSTVNCGSVDCVNYTLSLPGANPAVAAFTTINPVPAAPNGPPVNFIVDAQAFVPGSAGQQDCSSPDLRTPPISVSAGSNTPAPDITFTACQ
jgi:hypothetical protein